MKLQGGTGALGRAYRELALPKVAVTPAIEALAPALTVGIGDRREQAQRLYKWVSRNIRYVALEFGMGSIIPHDAGSVLDRRGRIGFSETRASACVAPSSRRRSLETSWWDRSPKAGRAETSRPCANSLGQKPSVIFRQSA